MTDQATAPEAETSTDIATIVEHNPVVVLLDEQKRDLLFRHIEEEIAAFVPDLTTTAGREAVRKFASKITRTKTAADKAGLALTEEWRANTAKVNVARNEVKKRLDEMADRARRPLTQWEEAEEKRLDYCENLLREITSMGVVPLEATAAQVEQAIAALDGIVLDPDRLQGMLENAIVAGKHSRELLTNALARIQKQEADRAELEALRAEAERRRIADMEQAEREKAEAAAREKARLEAERKEREEQEAKEAAERAEQARVEREKAEAERKAREEAEAAERARQAAAEAEARAKREAEEAAAREAARKEAEHQAQLAAERARAEAAERAAREAEEAREREEAARRQAEETEAARRAKAEADKAHRTKCKAEVKEVLLTTGITEDQAKAIVLLIVSREVPRVTLDFAAEPKVVKSA